VFRGIAKHPAQREPRSARMLSHTYRSSCGERPILTSIESEVAKTLCKAAGFCLTDFNLNSRAKRSLSARNESYLTDSFFLISIMLHVICTMEFEPAREDYHLFRVLQNQVSEKDDVTAIFTYPMIVCKLKQPFST